MKLPVKLRADLTNAGIARVGDDSEARTGDVPARIRKLRVVEDVKKLQADIESVILLNYGPLQYAEIGVVESRAVEEAPVGGAKSAQIGVNGECVGQEVTSRTVGSRATWIRLARIHRHDLADEIRHIRGRTSGERSITGVLVQLDGKAGRESRDSLNLPAAGQAFRRIAESPVERDGPNVTDHKIMSDVAG